MNDIIEMGRKMRQKRKELSLTLDEVAEVVKVAKSTVQRYEAGKIETPKILATHPGKEHAKDGRASARPLLWEYTDIPLPEVLSVLCPGIPDAH